VTTLREKLTSYAILAPFAIVLAFPFYWMIWTTFKTDQDLYNVESVPYVYNPSEGTGDSGWNWLPLGIEHATLRHWGALFDTIYATWLKNTVLVGLAVVVITLVLAMPAGYALARLSGRVGQGLGVAIFLTYLVPPTLLFLPMSRAIVEIGRLPGIDDERGLQDSLWALVLVYPSFTVPFATWLLMGFFKTIPRELEDAALVDGASRLRMIRSVVFPISIPGILTVIIFAFSLVLNEFVYALTFISSSADKTISTGVYTEAIRGDIYFWQGLMAAAVIPSIPLAILYNMFLNRFIAGFTGGAFR
jgi:multiple sugar transport system permease protein